MQDIFFDIVNREIVLSANDFETTVNPSIQNGGIILYSRGAHLQTPMVGISILEVINSDRLKRTYELNRWQQQVVEDGGKARWSIPATANPDGIFTEVNYL